MAEYILPKRGVAFIIYTSLVSQADTKLLIASPTLAAGDFKISKDGGATANLATLPTNTPAASSQIKISLSATEMEADNVTIVGIDAAGAEWCSFSLNIQTATRAAEDLAFPTTSGRSLDVTATGAAGIDWANVENPTTALNLSGTNIDVDQIVASVSGAVGSVTGAVGSVTGAVGSVTGAVGSVTGNVGGNVTGSVGSVVGAVGSVTGNVGGNVTGSVGSVVGAVGSVTGAVGSVTGLTASDVGAIKAKTDNLPAAPASTTNITGGTITTVTNLTNAPTAGDFTATMKTSITTAVPTANNNADALLDRADAIETGWTLRKILRIISAAVCGKVSGTPTAPVFRDVTNTKDRITGVADSTGARTTSTLDGT